MSQDDNIDEVALNVLLAQGVDFPTALEASRVPVADPAVVDESETTSSAPRSRAIEIVAIVLAVIVMIAIGALF